MQNTSNPSDLTIDNSLNALTGNSGHENGNGKSDGNHPAEIEITADSDVCLFTSSPSDSPRLDGDFIATVTKILIVELPPREAAGGKKPKAGKGKKVAKAKTVKPAARVLRFTLTLENKRPDGTNYTVEKDIRPKRSRDSKFAEFVGKLLPDTQALDQFFKDYRPSQLLNRRCSLKIKEVRRMGQSNLKILDIAAVPAPVLAIDNTPFGQTEPALNSRLDEGSEPIRVAA